MLALYIYISTLSELHTKTGIEVRVLFAETQCRCTYRCVAWAGALALSKRNEAKPKEKPHFI